MKTVNEVVPAMHATLIEFLTGKGMYMAQAAVLETFGELVGHMIEVEEGTPNPNDVTYERLGINLTGSQVEEIKSMVNGQRKIECIKWVRGLFNIGLKEAKEMVEDIAVDSGLVKMIR